MARSTNITGLICIMLIGVVVASFGVGEPLDVKLLDAQFRLLRAQFLRPAPEVVVVGIDEATVAQFYEPVSLWHPHLAKFLQAMTRAKPAALGIDLVLPDRSFDRIAPGYDKALLKGIIEARREFPLVLALTIDPDGKQPGLKYQFALTDDTGHTLHEAQLETTALKLPASVQLMEGVPYTWKVSARLPDGRKYSSAGDFSVAPASLRAQAEALRPAVSAPLSSRVAYAGGLIKWN